MRRRVGFAETALLFWLLSVQAGCGWAGLAAGQTCQPPILKRRPRHSKSSSTLRWPSIAATLPPPSPALEEQVVRSPASAVAQHWLGTVYFLEGRFSEARDCFSRALKLDPDYVDALIGLGQVETQEGDAESARTLRNCDRDRPAPHSGTLLPR